MVEFIVMIIVIVVVVQIFRSSRNGFFRFPFLIVFFVVYGLLILNYGIEVVGALTLGMAITYIPGLLLYEYIREHRRKKDLWLQIRRIPAALLVGTVKIVLGMLLLAFCLAIMFGVAWLMMQLLPHPSAEGLGVFVTMIYSVIALITGFAPMAYGFLLIKKWDLRSSRFSTSGPRH
jgi:hypothetical protein